MAVVTQIKLGTSGTTYDINDERIKTTAVNTATHLLTTDSGVTSIAPITTANLASVLGVGSGAKNVNYGVSWNNGRIYKYSSPRFAGTLYLTNNDTGGIAIYNICKKATAFSIRKVYHSNSEATPCYFYHDSEGNLYIQHIQNWGAHVLIASDVTQDGYVTSVSGLTEITVSDGTFYNNYDNLSSLASALGVGDLLNKQDVPTDADAVMGNGGIYGTSDSTQHLPVQSAAGLLICIKRFTRYYQIFLTSDEAYYRFYWTSWGEWKKINLPYLSSYSDLPSLASALGVGWVSIDKTSGATTEITIIKGGILILDMENGETSVYALGYNKVVPIYEAQGHSETYFTLTHDNATLTITNKTALPQNTKYLVLKGF